MLFHLRDQSPTAHSVFVPLLLPHQPHLIDGEMDLEGLIVLRLVHGGILAFVPGSKSILFTPYSVVVLKVRPDYWFSVSSPARWQILLPLQGGRLHPMKPQASPWASHLWPAEKSALQVFDTFMLSLRPLLYEEVTLIWGHLILGVCSHK